MMPPKAAPDRPPEDSLLSSGVRGVGVVEIVLAVFGGKVAVVVVILRMSPVMVI